MLFLVHRKELVDQITRTFIEWGVDMDYCTVGMVQTITRRVGKMQPPTLIITDENHHSLASTYKRIYDAFPRAYRVGVTATPVRLNGDGLGDVNDRLVIGVSAKWLIENHFLAPYDYYAPSVADLTGLHVRQGEYLASEIEARMMNSAVYGDVISHYTRLGGGQKAICYCASIKHSTAVAEAFNAAGIPARHIDGETPKPERAKIINDFRAGRVPVLCGGTGLYIKAIVDHIQYEEETGEDAALRERLRRQAQDEGNLAVWRQLQAMDPQTAERIHPNNLGRVIRAIEVMQVSGRSIREQEERSRQAPCPYHVIQIGLRYRNRENLYERIGRRVDAMAEAGLLEEARAVRQQGLTATAAQAIGYKELYDWMDGTLPLEEALENLKRSTRRYAKRQLTWFGADARIRWIEPDALQAGETVTEQAMRIIENDGEETA